MIGNGKKKLQKEKSENEILRLSKNNVLKPTIITHVQCVARDAQKNTRSLTMRHGANDALNGIVVIAKWNVLQMNDSFTLLMESLRRDFEITFADNNSIVCDIEWGIS